MTNKSFLLDPQQGRSYVFILVYVSFICVSVHMSTTKLPRILFISFFLNFSTAIEI